MPTSSYQNFELQPLAGHWRAGQSERKLQVVNPFNQENLLELNLATKEDLDESFIAAREAQKSWALMAPAARAAIMLKAVAIFDQRHDEIVEWIIAESGQHPYQGPNRMGGGPSDHTGSRQLPVSGSRLYFT